MRRIFTLVAALIVAAGIAAAVYFLVFSPSSPHLTATSGATFPSSGTAAPSGTNASTATPGTAGTVVAPGLIKITSQPVSAGVAVFDTVLNSGSMVSTTTSSTTPGTADIAIHYIDRASGNVYEYDVFSRALTRISNKTLPGIQLASWVADGSEAFAQFLSNSSGTEQIDTYALPATGNGGYFLQSGLAQATVMGSSTLFTLATNATASVGTVANADGSNPKTLFTSALTSIQVQAAGNGYIAVTKAANSLNGYVFAVSNNTFTPILGPYRGLTALASPNGNLILYSYTDGNQFHMNVYDRTTGGFVSLPLATLAEKCVWTPNSTQVYCAVPVDMSQGTVPDDWYQGAISFTDRIWRIDLASRLATLIVDPSDANTAIDAVNLAIDPSGHVLVFRNKRDSSLWAYTSL